MEGSKICGHVGIAGNISQAHERLFEDMLVVDSVRGIDSVGVAAVSTYGHVSVYKKAMFVHDFLQTKGFGKLLRTVSRVLIGHNRWATKGGISNHTAHPFEFDTVVGAHNGTLKNQSLLPNHRDYAIDSENIFHSIDTQGIEKTYENINGAAALVYYDKLDKTLNFIRNAERPFFFTYSEDRKTLFWASEEWMLSGLLSKHRIKHTAIIATVIDHHYSMPFEGFKAADPLPKMRIRKLKAYIPPYQYNYGQFGQQSSPNQYEAVINKVKKRFPIGSTVKFSYIRGKIAFGAGHVDCFVQDDATMKVKLFVNSFCKDLNANLVQGHKFDFVGRVNGFDGQGNILVQSNSVTSHKILKAKDKPLALVKDKPKEDDLYIDFGGTALNKEQFDDLSKAARDCCWCSSPLEFKEGNVIINSNTSLCDICAEDAEVKLCIGDFKRSL